MIPFPSPNVTAQSMLRPSEVTSSEWSYRSGPPSHSVVPAPEETTPDHSRVPTPLESGRIFRDSPQVASGFPEPTEVKRIMATGVFYW